MSGGCLAGWSRLGWGFGFAWVLGGLRKRREALVRLGGSGGSGWL